jgi:hypothetical protein
LKSNATYSNNNINIHHHLAVAIRSSIVLLVLLQLLKVSIRYGKEDTEVVNLRPWCVKNRREEYKIQHTPAAINSQIIIIIIIIT